MENPAADEKRALRDERLSYLRSWRFPDRASAALCQAVRTQPSFLSARTVALFVARAWEPDLTSLFGTRPRACVFPRVDPRTRTMRFFHVPSLQVLVRGFGGILEPPATGMREATWAPGDLLLVPGVIFDRQGRRLGSGAGFYDRLLAGLPAGCLRWGVTAEDLLSETGLAQEPTDVKMQAIFTESRVYWIHE